MKKKYTKASITTYVIIMFGLIAMFYMMGFTNAWSNWQATATSGADTGSIENPGVFDPLFNSIQSNAIYLIAFLGVATVIAGVFAKLTGTSYVFTYIIPLALLALFANIFLFPIESIEAHTQWMIGAVPLSVILIAFFNIFLFLSILEFIRGAP